MPKEWPESDEGPFHGRLPGPSLVARQSLGVLEFTDAGAGHCAQILDCSKFSSRVDLSGGFTPTTSSGVNFVSEGRLWADGVALPALAFEHDAIEPEIDAYCRLVDSGSFSNASISSLSSRSQGCG